MPSTLDSLAKLWREEAAVFRHRGQGELAKMAESFAQDLETEVGDFVIRRADGLPAYQLAVVLDDAFQGVTEVVRGADLLDSTPRQIYLQQRLEYPQPGYLHLPLMLDEHGRKLGKSEGAAALNPDRPAKSLCTALQHLGQQPPSGLANAAIADIWQWAMENWSTAKIPTKPAVIKIP